MTIEAIKMRYTMRDVNRLQVEKKWPRVVALNYYWGLSLIDGNSISDSIRKNYTKELRLKIYGGK